MRYVKLGMGMTLLAFTVGTPLSGIAEGGQSPQPMSQGVQAQSKKLAAAPSMPVYQPPKRGAPGGRVGGGTRGPGDDLPTLLVLAPDHVGLTTQEQPTLYWYLSKPTTYPIELTIIQGQGTKPSLETVIRPPSSAQAGVQQARLAGYGFRLLPGVQYKWFVALIPNPTRRSKDIIAGGIIERVAPPEVVQTKLTQTDKASSSHVYAEYGLWYDAVTSISSLIDTMPNDLVLRKQRASLMEQVGLIEIAKYDLSYITAVR